MEFKEKGKTAFKKQWLFAKKRILALGFGLGMIAVLVGAIALLQGTKEEAVGVSAEITNWGLSFQQEGKTPVGNAGVAELAKYDGFFVGDEQEKEIYLTFDAGYENGDTEKILDALKKHGVSATFFLVGNYLETQPALVKRMVEEGHAVGNHTWSHPDMSKIESQAAFQEELAKVEAKYKEITGEEMQKLYRPPQGKYCRSNLEMAKEMGYKTVFWSLAYVDWYNDKQPTKEEAFSKLLPRIHPGAVVLLHSTSRTNGEIMDELLTKWEEMGYKFGKIESLWT